MKVTCVFSQKIILYFLRSSVIKQITLWGGADGHTQNNLKYPNDHSKKSQDTLTACITLCILLPASIVMSTKLICCPIHAFHSFVVEHSLIPSTK